MHADIQVIGYLADGRKRNTHVVVVKWRLSCIERKHRGRPATIKYRSTIQYSRDTYTHFSLHQNPTRNRRVAVRVPRHVTLSFCA